MSTLYILLSAFAGSIITWIFLKNKMSSLDKEKSVFQERLNNLQKDKELLQNDLGEERKKSEALSTQFTKVETENKGLVEKLNSQKEELGKLQEKFKMEFENIAGRILKTHSDEFTQLNKKNIGDILTPLKEKIVDFEKKVNDTYNKELQDKTSLKTEVKMLYELNKKISEEANNLTKALKGDVKKQGNWGEFVLERILERSGLVKGENYEVQYSAVNDEGRRVQPDVIVHLPDRKHIIIDSKVSLVAYENYVNSATDEEKQKYVKEHVASVRKHIKELGEKKYQTLEGLNAPDFVLLFIPIEASFSIAVQEDRELFNYAWDYRIVIVTPSTLLATLLTVVSMWKQESQTKNAIEIARQSGALYDKFVGFVDDLQKVGERIDSVKSVYEDAMNKLHTGKGNLISKTENIRKLGAKASKSLPDKFLDSEDDLLVQHKNDE